MGADADNSFATNLDDPRFSALLTAPEFALDPTDPRFKQPGGQNAAMQKAASKAQSARGMRLNEAPPPEPRAGAGAAGGSGVMNGEGAAGLGDVLGNGEKSGKGTKAELGAMVASLKNKAAKRGFGKGARGDGGGGGGGGKSKKQRV